MDSTEDHLICHLVSIVGALCLTFAAVTLLEPEYLFTATVPLITVGVILIVLAQDTRFQKLMAAGTCFGL